MSTYTSNTLDITSKSTLNSQSFASVASDTKKPPATSIATVIGEGHACNPTTRCAIGLACYLRNATSTATLFNIANEPDATCQLASTPGFILAHPLAANAPLSEHPVPLRWPTFVNGPLAGLGSSCQLMTIPRNNTLKAWLSARNEIDLSIIGNCVENAYCQSDSILNHNATLSGQCKQRLEDHRGCTGHNQCISGYCQYSLDAGHGVCMSNGGFLNEPTYRAFHVTLWFLLASALLLLVAIILSCHRRRVKPAPTPSCAWNDNLPSTTTVSLTLPPPVLSSALSSSSMAIEQNRSSGYVVNHDILLPSNIQSNNTVKDDSRPTVWKRLSYRFSIWRTHGVPRWFIAIIGSLSLTLLIADVVYMMIPWPYSS